MASGNDLKRRRLVEDHVGWITPVVPLRKGVIVRQKHRHHTEPSACGEQLIETGKFLSRMVKVLCHLGAGDEIVSAT